MPKEILNQIARLSQGDIRHAITSLQYLSIGTEKSKKSSFRPEETSTSAMETDIGLSGRDETLSLFHALGKFLHNKRVDGDLSSMGNICVYAI